MKKIISKFTCVVGCPVGGFTGAGVGNRVGVNVGFWVGFWEGTKKMKKEKVIRGNIKINMLYEIKLSKINWSLLKRHIWYEL